MERKRLRPGDFVQVTTPKGLGYLRFFGKLEGQLAADIFAVLDNPEWRQVRDLDLPKLGIAYWLGSAQEFFRDDPRAELRRGPAASRADAPLVWRLTTLRGWRYLRDGVESLPREIDDEMARLPIAAMIPFNRLVEYMVSGWTPDLDRVNGFTKLSEAIQIARASKTPKALTVLVGFDSAEQASQACVLLKRRGFATEARSEGLVLAVTSQPSRAVTNWIDIAEHVVMSVAHPFGGQYEGNEVEV